MFLGLFTPQKTIIMTHIPSPQNVSIEELILDADNPNEMKESQLVALQQNIETYGFIIPIITNKELKVADGHQRLRAAKALGMKTVPVIRLDIDEPDRLILQQVLNKLRGTHDEIKDAEIFKKLYDADRLAKLSDLLDEKEKRFHALIEKHRQTKEETVEVTSYERAKNKTTIKKGDLYVLGDHKLLCGDSTKESDWQKLLGEEKADMLFTDPPYNVDYSEKVEALNKADGGKRNTTPVQNDAMNTEEWHSFCNNWIQAAKKHVEGDIYVWTRSGPDGLRLQIQLIEENVHWSSTIVWKKNVQVLSRSNYHHKYEPCFYGWIGNKSSYLGNKQNTDVWEFDKPTKSKLHPTMKPIELCTEAIKNSSTPTKIVMDAFGGSGSTLIACEQTDRQCRMIEIDPVYCQIIIDRWEALTGKKAVKQ